MKLNRSQPFGTVAGHEWALYEQNGVLFDGAGQARDTATVIDKASRDSRRVITLKTQENAQELAVKNAMEFLRNLLSGGPIDKAIVYREAENNNQQWENVKTAFVRMHGQVIKRGGTTGWRILPEMAGK